MTKKNIVKILVPVLIVLAVIMIIVIKKASDAPEASAVQDSTTAGTEAHTVSDGTTAASVPPAVQDSTAIVTEDTGAESSDTVYPLKITSVDLNTIKSYGVPTVIDFGSDSCIPCKQMAPVLETLNAEFQGRAAVQFMDIWQYTDGVQDFPIQVIPTQVFFTAEGKPFVPSDELAAKIRFDMYSLRDTGEHVFTVHQGGITEDEMRMIFSEMGID